MELVGLPEVAARTPLPPPPSDSADDHPAGNDHDHDDGGPPAGNEGGDTDPPPPPSDHGSGGGGVNPPPPPPSDPGSSADEDRAAMARIMRTMDAQMKLMVHQQKLMEHQLTTKSAGNWAPKMAKPDTLTRKKVETSSGEAVIAWMESVEYYAKRAGGGLNSGDIGYQSLDAELKAMVRGFCSSQTRRARLEDIAKEILSIVTGDPGMPALQALLTAKQRESGQDVRAFEDWIRKNQCLLLLTRSKHLPPSVVGPYVTEDYRKLKLITCVKPSLRGGLLPRAANEAPAGMGAWDIPLGRLREILCDLESEAKVLAQNSVGHFASMSTDEAPRPGGGRHRGSTHTQVLRTRNSLLFKSLSEEQKDRARRFKSSIPQDIKNKMSRGQVAGDWAGKIAQAGHCKRCGDYGCCPDDHKDSSLAKLQRQIEASRH